MDTWENLELTEDDKIYRDEVNNLRLKMWDLSNGKQFRTIMSASSLVFLDSCHGVGMTVEQFGENLQCLEKAFIQSFEDFKKNDVNSGVNS